MIELKEQLKDLNENNLKCMTALMDSRIGQIEKVINVKLTKNEMESSLKNCMNVIGDINDSLKKYIFEILSQLKNE